MKNNAAIFLSGRLATLVVLLAFQLIVVRVLAPVEYGRYALIFAWASLMQTAMSFGIPRIIPKYVGQAGWGLSSAATRRLVVAIVAFRLGASILALAGGYVIGRAIGWIEPTEPGLIVVGTGYVLISLVQVDADAMAQALGLQPISRACLIGEAVVRFVLVGLLAMRAGGMSAVAILSVSLITLGAAAAILLTAVLRTLTAQSDADSARPLDRTEFRTVALSGYASAMAWFASSPAVIRLIASRLLSISAFAGLSFMQTLVLSFQRYTPGMLLFPFVEPAVMRHHARTGDRSRLEAALSLITKIDLIAIGATIVGTIVAGRPLVELMTGGRYGEIAYALPWLLTYIVASSVYRAFEIVAIALGAAAALVRPLVFSLGWLAIAIAFTPRFGPIVLLLCPVADSLSRLALVHDALRRSGVRHVIDLKVGGAIVALIGLCGGIGATAVRYGNPGPARVVAIGTIAALVYLVAIAAIRPLRHAEADLLAGARPDRTATLIRRYARA